jgi:hypothetical protein
MPQPIERDENNQVETYAWPGGYPLFYMVQGDVLCPKCVNDNPDNDSFNPDAVDVNYEDTELYCCNCNEQIEAAYRDNNGE